MQHCEHEVNASLYGLGLLEQGESRAFEQHLGSCSACAGEVRESGKLAVDLAGALPASVPPANLRARVLAQATLPRGLVALVRGAQLHWEPTDVPGISIATLYRDPTGGEVASLLRMAAGSRYPAHHHSRLEHCYVLEGDLIFEDHALSAGDYAAATPGEDHSTATTEKGCVLFLVHELRNETRKSAS